LKYGETAYQIFAISIPSGKRPPLHQTQNVNFSIELGEKAIQIQ
jgi:hypothetical protein